jgi:hypothetical protein
MKKLFLTLILSLHFFSMTVHAEPVQADNAEAYRWLYEKLIPEEIRLEQPAASFKSFRVHLEDSYQVFPDPDLIGAANLKPSPSARIQGWMTYAGLFKKKYTHDVFQDASGQWVFNVRVRLKNGTPQDEVDFRAKIKAAEAMWNQYRPALDFQYRFQFDLVNDPAEAQYSVQVLDSTRGPYDQFWGRDWTAIVIAHEIGHMLGLGDEYQTLSSVTDCYKPSLMCDSWHGMLMEHHYYFILRRLLR